MEEEKKEKHSKTLNNTLNKKTGEEKPKKQIRLLKSGVPAHKFTREEQIRGGMSKSPNKRLGAIYRHLVEKCKTPEQAEIIMMARVGKFDEVAKMIAAIMSSKEKKDEYDWLPVLDRIIKLIPQRTLNLHGMTGEVKVRWVGSEEEDSEEEENEGRVDE